ncbi:MAG TPA: hypothetical protein PK082_09075, partial [Phycisphaerae bacterium]|nr:hypothetical protein [Phycisphaerae bacterium]
MSRDYSPDTCRTLVEKFRQAGIHRRLRVDRYEAGDELVYEATGVVPALPVRVKLRIDKFIGGGFAGQVYRANVTAIDAPQGNVPGLRVGGTYAVKILIPPSAFSRTFRDAIYAVGFQGPFSHQVNPAAVRAGALWQKFIQRATAIRFGDDRAVKDVLATFVDRDIGSCGEISEWVEGRNWRFEVDDRLGQRRRWCRGKDVPAELLGSPEYRAKKTFMAEFVRLLHELGAHEFARQYEWWTCKSQPNVFKRLDTESDPEAGLTAMDFRAGLALLPFLPMSPGDVPLIFKGLARGSLVQFDRGDLSKLRRFVDGHREHFSDMGEAMDELAAAEDAYRNSQPDVTHNHMRLLYSRKLWAGIFDAAVTGWQVRNITDEETTRRLRRSRTMTFLFALAGLLPLVGAATAVAALVVGLRTAAPGWPLAGAVAALAVVPGALG